MKPRPNSIDEIDRQILQLLQQRFALHQQLQKEGQSIPFPYHSLQWFQDQKNSPFPPQSLMDLFQGIDALEQELLAPIRIGYLGPVGTFTHQAAIKHFGSQHEWESLETIEDVFTAVIHHRIDFGVVPIENSTEGAVNVTFDLFIQYDVRIWNEIFLPIHHCMMIHPKTQPEQIQAIYSHPQVFAQCRRWLQTHYSHCVWKETPSTALAAERIRNELNAAAIGGELPAQLYNLTIIHKNIEDFTNNTTRFLVITQPNRGFQPPTGNDKTSLMFALIDRPGVLYDALLPFKRHNVNLTMIESRPSRQQNWEYVFFVDFQGHAEDEPCAAALLELHERCQFMRVLGSYPMGV